jgi:hypothetical protein
VTGIVYVDRHALVVSRPIHFDETLGGES